MMKNKKHILILGGGIGGITAAKELQRLLNGVHRITVINKETHYLFQPSLPWLAIGRRTKEQITVDLRRIVNRGIDFRQAEISSINTEKKTIGSNLGDMSYDFLVAALGATLNLEALPGLSEAIIPYNVTGAERLNSELASFQGGKIAIVIPALPYKCPAAPHEFAFLIDAYLSKKGLRARTSIDIYTVEGQPMPTAGPEIGSAIRQLLEKRVIGFHAGHKTVNIDYRTKNISFENGNQANFDLVIAIPPHQAPSVIRQSSLAGETGWIPVDRNTLAANSENIYAIGDVASVSLPGRYKPDMPLMLPKAGVFASSQAKVVAANIASQITGKSAENRFDGKGACFMETGYGKAGFATGNFFGDAHPEISMKGPGRLWHFSKLLFERHWLRGI